MRRVYIQFQAGLSLLLLQSCGNLSLKGHHQMRQEEVPVVEEPLQAVRPLSDSDSLPATPPHRPSSPLRGSLAHPALEGEAEDKDKGHQSARRARSSQELCAVMVPLFNRALANPNQAMSGLEIYKKFLVRYAPELALASASTIYQKWFVEMEDVEVRLGTLRTFRYLVQVDPYSAPQLRTWLEEASRDSSPKVACEALHSLGKLVEAVPGEAEAVLKGLLGNARESAADLDLALLAAMTDLIKAAPSLEVLGVLLQAMSASDEEVRSVAIIALVKLLKVAPHWGNAQVLSDLRQAVQGSSWSVRQAATSALGELVKIRPDLFGEEVLVALCQATQDPNRYVAEAAIAALVELLKACPDHAELVLAALFQATRDLSGYVRRAARGALRAIRREHPDLGHDQVHPELNAT